MRKQGNNVRVYTDDPREGSHTFGFLVWTGLLRDFALAQRGIISSASAKKILGSQFVTAATGSVVNMENDVRRHPSQVYLPATLSPEFDNDICLSIDVYAELVVSNCSVF